MVGCPRWRFPCGRTSLWRQEFQVDPGFTVWLGSGLSHDGCSWHQVCAWPPLLAMPVEFWMVGQPDKSSVVWMWVQAAWAKKFIWCKSRPGHFDIAAFKAESWRPPPRPTLGVLSFRGHHKVFFEKKLPPFFGCALQLFLPHLPLGTLMWRSSGVSPGAGGGVHRQQGDGAGGRRLRHPPALHRPLRWGCPPHRHIGGPDRAVHRLPSGGGEGKTVGRVWYGSSFSKRFVYSVRVATNAEYLAD